MWQRLRDAVDWRVRRARKYLWQWRNLRSREGAAPVFVVGAQRSGTNMFMAAVDRSASVWIYNEGSRRAFSGVRLRRPQRIARLILRCPARTVVFEPVCDSHRTDRLLQQHPGSKAIWIYRSYVDVVNSAIPMWGGNQRAIRWIAEGNWRELGWRGERLSLETTDLVEHHYQEGVSPAEATALFWYLRTSFYFDLGLDRDSRVLLARYEDLVGDPQAAFRRCFELLGCEFEPELVSDIAASSVGNEAAAPIKPEIAELCEARMRQFDSSYKGAESP